MNPPNPSAESLSVELLSCPFCGSNDVQKCVVVALKYERNDYVRSKCRRCLAYGPAILVRFFRDGSSNREEAALEAPMAWNTRHAAESQLKAQGWQEAAEDCLKWVRQFCSDTGCNEPQAFQKLRQALPSPPRASEKESSK